MNYKSLFLVVVFALFLGVNNSSAQCDCIDEIGDAVTAVMGTSGCDVDGEWNAPHSLEVHLAKLENWCGVTSFLPKKSKQPNIVKAMLEVIEDAYAGEWHEEWSDDLQADVVVWDEIPAPECAWPALEALKSALDCVD